MDPRTAYDENGRAGYIYVGDVLESLSSVPDNSIQ